MIYIGRDNRAPGGDFSAHKLRGDILRQPRAKPNARMLPAQHFATNTLAAHIFANGDELHLRGDNPLPGVVQLSHAFPDHGAPGGEQAGKAQLVEAIIRQPLFGIRRTAVVEFFTIATRINPWLTQFFQTLLNVNRDVRIAVGAGGVIDRNRFIRFVLRIIFAAADKGRAKLDFAHRDANIFPRTVDIDALRIGKCGTFQRVDKALGVFALLSTREFCCRHSSFQLNRIWLARRRME